MNPAIAQLARKTAGGALGLALCLGLLAAGITREIPYGGVEGRVVLMENGRPLLNSQVILRPSTSLSYEAIQRMPEETRPKSYVTETDGDGRYRIRNVRAGMYELEVYASAHSVKPITVSIAEGKPSLLDVELKPNDPYIDLYASQHVFRPGEKVQVQLHGFTPAERVRIVAYKLSAQKIIASGSLRRALSPLAGVNSASAPISVDIAEKVAEVDPQITQRDAEGIFRQFFDLPPLAEGIYWVDCTVAGMRRGTYVNVTDLAMVLKQARGQALCFVTRLDSGKPVAGAEVFYPKANGLTSASKTGANGVVRYAVPKGDRDDRNTMAYARFGTSQAFVDFYTQSGDQSGQTRVFLYTERPIYRPGDVVQFKGIVRKLVDSDYRLPGSGSVEIEIRDPDATLIEKTAVPLNAMGSFAGRFSTNRGAAPGEYAVKIRFGDHEQTEQVSIAAYRKPEYSVKVYPEKPYYIRGEGARMVVDVQYYFGAPVAGAQVSAAIQRAPRWEWLDSEMDPEEVQEYEGGSYGGEWLDTVEVTTDENGRAYVDFATKFDDKWDDETDSDFTVTADVSDGDKYFSGEGKVKVVRGDIGLVAEASDYVADIGALVTVSIRSFTQPDGKSKPGITVRLTAGFDIWTGGESVFRTMATKTVVTDKDGTERVSFTPNRGGSFVVKAELTDTRGNRVASSAYTYVYGGASSDERPPEGMISIKLDKRKYAVGDTIRAVIETDRPGGSALLTTEGEKVYSATVVPLTGHSTKVSIPVTSEHRPNAFVNVAYVHSKRFAQSTRRFGIDLGEKRVNVSISSDKPAYNPGDRAVYTIRTTGDGSKPVSADVSLGIVDESIYAIANDRTDVVNGFYPKRYNAVQTSYSFEEIYLDGGDKAPSDIQIRSIFKDTAAWIPFVKTDAQGRATVQVQLPENLTTWRATAVAVSVDTAVGMATQKVRARKDLMVRVLTPAFLVQQDRQRVLVMVTNDSGREAEVRVDLEPDILTREGDARQNVRIGAGRTESLEWWVSAPRPGLGSLTARAWIDQGASDGMKKSIEVQPHGRAFTDYQAGDVQTNSSVTVAVRPGADAATGRLAITVAPSLASSILQSLDELVDYPYGCVEQTLSRFVPTVVAAKAVKDANLPPPKLAPRIPELVAEGYARLKRMQHSDGGWGWWEYDESDPFMTAMVLEGMFRAKQAGFEPNSFAVDRGLKWLEKELVKPEPIERKDDWRVREKRSNRLYAAYALALWGRSAPAIKVLQTVDPTVISAYDAATVALAYGALGPDYAAFRNQMLDFIARSAKIAGGRATWPERYWGSETTARCLLALATLRPDEPLIPKAIRALMLARRGDMWMSTRDTNCVVIALSEYWRRTQELGLSGQLTISLNGRAHRTFKLSREMFTSPDLRIDVPISALSAGNNRVEFRKTGPGTVYFSTELRQTVIQDKLGPMVAGPGLSIDRKFVRLSAQRMEDGTLQLRPEPGGVNEATRGDILKCEVTVKTAQPREYVMVEVPIPCNVHVTEREEIGEYEEWTWWFNKLVIRDDRVAFFVRNLDAGEHTFTFAFQAESVGSASAMPAVVFNMYDPGERSSSAETKLTVNPK